MARRMAAEEGREKEKEKSDYGSSMEKNFVGGFFFPGRHFLSGVL